MKNLLLALAALGTLAGAASAQSSVTMFGVVDLSANSIKNGNANTQSLQSNQLNSNRLGFRGIEDLGGGLKAGFWLEAGMAQRKRRPRWRQRRSGTVERIVDLQSSFHPECVHALGRDSRRP